MDEASIVVSDSGEILSPKYAPEIIAPAIHPSLNPCALPMPIRAIPIVAIVVPWKDYELAITNNISGVATAIIILLIIGALSGAWMISGIVPTLIYYGMQIIHPDFFLASTCIICALISVMTGSSWTTIATIGIALMGIGKAQGNDGRNFSCNKYSGN